MFVSLHGFARRKSPCAVLTSALLLALGLLSCSGGGSSGPPPPPGITVTVTPNPVNVQAGSSQQFNAAVTGTTNTAVTWQVNGITGGNSAVGTIDSAGLFRAPTTAPSPATVTITAVSQADTTKSGSASATIVAMAAFPGTFTWRNDNARTGQNRQETALTPATVNPAKFGKVFSFPVDGEVYAQPLYVPNVPIPGQGTRNVVYVATEHDTVYAFDADGRTLSPFWTRSLIPPGGTTVPFPLPSPDFECPRIIEPEVGITGTPVIDPQTNTLYVVAATKESSNFVQRLHALDIATGAEKFGGPKVIQATVRGIGAGGDGQGNIPFDPLRQNQRTALLLSGGRVYIAWASFCDADPYHGWLLGYSAATLQQVAVFNTTPNGTEGGIWQSGAGLSADSSGNIYAITGNGTFDPNTGGFGDSFLKLNANLTTVLDFFTPFNQALLSETDLDVGSGGAVLLPDQPGTAHPHLVLGGGKEGKLYLVDRDNLGKYQRCGAACDDIVQSFMVSDAGFFSTPAFWENNVYIAGRADALKAFSLSAGLLSTTPTSQSSAFFEYPGATPVVSSNGSTNGIVWALDTSGSDPDAPTPAILYAYDAADLSKELYNSTAAGDRDTAGPAVRFAVPTVANGRVYVGAGREVTVYGLLP